MLIDEVTGVGRANRHVLLRDGPQVPFDHLVLATGADYSFFGHDDWAAHAKVLKSLDDALRMREDIVGAFELAELWGEPGRTAELLAFVVVGGGPTGVELAGTIAGLARSTLASDFRTIDPRVARIILREAGHRVLAGFPERLSAYARRALQTIGVDVRLGQAVDGLDAQGLSVGGIRIVSPNIFWCAGARARPAASRLGAAMARNGGVMVDPDCSVPGLSPVCAIGDVATTAAASQSPDSQRSRSSKVTMSVARSARRCPAIRRQGRSIIMASARWG